MRIGVVAHLRYPIAPPFCGGMEAHCHSLVRALAARGHDVTLFASGDSDARLPLVAIAPCHYQKVLPWADWHGSPELTAFQEDAFARAWRVIREGEFDVVHNNTLFPSFHAWALSDEQPMVTSLHIPPFAGLADIIGSLSAPWLRQTTTSLAHHQTWWSTPPNSASVVYNGIDEGRWPFQIEGNGRAVWCGRITSNKGTAIAIDAARAAGLALDIIGPVDCPTYFEAEVAPRLDDRFVWRGHLSGNQLTECIGRASVMLSTPMWDEPFGLVVAEALACGVPVAALDRGAMREVIGDAGALAASPHDLPRAITQAMKVSRHRCRKRVEALFSIDRMIAGYESAYAAAIAGLSRSSTASTRELLA